MNKTITILLILISVCGVSQSTDSLSITSNIQGSWVYKYSVNLDSLGGELDTFYTKTELFRADIGLIISKESVNEFWDYWDYSADSTEYFGSGNWEMVYTENKQWLNFNCDGFLLCGNYEFLALQENILILKSCTKHEECELTHFTRKIKP